MNDQPERSEPVIQRVPSGTRGPIVVAVVLLLVVGLLIAKPWDSPPPFAAAVPTTAESAASPLSATAPVSRSPAPGTTGTPIPYPPYTPTPLPTDTPAPAVGAVFTVEFEPDGALTTCTYERHGRKRRLASIEVPAPRAYVLSDRGNGRERPVIFWFELIANSEETLFDADWTFWTESGFLASAAVDGEPADLASLVLDLDDAALADLELNDTTVVRARMVVDWQTDVRQAETRSEIVATSYLSASPLRMKRTTYCPYVLANEPPN
jgi:hypothetical protein